MNALGAREENLRHRPIRVGQDNELLLSAAAGGVARKRCAAP